MEKQLKEISTEALTNQKVSGFLCVDQNGLCLTASGEANERSSGTVASIAELAQKLDNSNSPVISIESDKKKILIKTVNQITTAIYKHN